MAVSAYRDWRAWLGLVLASSLVLLAAFAYVTRSSDELFELRGRSEGTVIERFGPPDRDFEVTESHAGPEFRAVALRRSREARVRELIWKGPFRTTHVWVVETDGEWIVFHSYNYANWLKH